MTERADRVRTLFLMELRTLLRDRRTVALSIVLPLVVTPLMLFASRMVEQRRQRALEGRTSPCAVTGPRADTARALLERARDLPPPEGASPRALLRLDVRTVANPASALADGDLDFYLVGRDFSEADADRQRRTGRDEQGRRDEREPDTSVAAGFDTGDPAGVPPADLLALSVVFRADRDTSRRAAERVLERLRRVRREQRYELLSAAGFPARPAEVTPVEPVNLADEGQVAGLTLGRLITLLLLFFLLSGGAVVAQDTLAGEKERGTLETLLTTAISRREIVAAKVLLVLAVALAITVIQVLNLLVYVGFGVVPTSQNLTAAVTPSVAVALLVYLLPLAVLVAGILVLVSGYARSHREAQLYFLPLMLGLAVPALAAFLPEVSLRSAIAFVPVANTSVGVKEMLVGRFDWPMLAVAWIVNGAVAAWVLRMAARLLSTERLIVPTAGDALADGARRGVRPGQVAAWFAVMWALILVISLNMGPDFDIRGQLVVNLIVIMLGGSLLFVRRFGLDPREAFSLRLPHPSAWIAVLIGVPAALVAGIGIFRLSQLVLPVPPEMVKSLGQYLMPDDVPVWQVLPMLTLLPGICEELTFRGVLLSSLRRHYTPARAALASAIVFGLFHFAIFRIIPTAYLGVVLAVVVLLSGSIYPAMAWHALSNGLALMAGRFGWDLQAASPLAIAAAVATLAVSFAILSKWGRLNGVGRSLRENGVGRSFFEKRKSWGAGPRPRLRFYKKTPPDPFSLTEEAPMPHRLNSLVPLVAGVLLAAPSIAPARAQAPSHKHYTDEHKAHDQPSPTGQLAPRLQNLGTHTFPVTTTSKEAQLFINQGLNLSYGFNHAEAGRAFREAARLDPNCAMAYWGQALVLGPNINATMDPNDEPKALELVQQAMALRSKASVRERALIEALAERYSGKPEDRAARDKAYAAAMHAVARRFPDDLDAITLHAESVMDLRPWGYWMPDGTPYEGTREIVAALESVMQRNPNHPGALHLYIHLLEPTDEPEKAEAAADKLLTLMPAAGHMVHMPSHIYQRVGRYDDAVRSNELAVQADEDYITQCRAQGLYPMGYYPHNIHFLWFAATMDGRGAMAIDAAKKVAAKIPDEAMKELPLLAGFRVVPYFALTRFGRWDEMLAEPAPPRDNVFLTAAWHYSRGLAQVAKGRLSDADRSLATLKGLVADKSLDYPLFSPNTAAAILAIAPDVLAGELAAARKDFDRAVAHLERAVRLEDGLVYTEPAEWHYPPRHALGAVLLQAGRAREAETVYWEDLRRNPNNGWALYGLLQALRAQGKTDQAAVVEQRFEKAWARADIRLAASRVIGQ